MAERSKALRSGRSPLLWAWVRIPLLTEIFTWFSNGWETALRRFRAAVVLRHCSSNTVRSLNSVDNLVGGRAVALALLQVGLPGVVSSTELEWGFLTPGLVLA